MISVPDLRALCWLYTRHDIDTANRFNLMRIIFGGQHNQYDIHKVGFDFDILCLYLSEAGFMECQRVFEFNLFKDFSITQLFGTPISLNVIATK